MCPDLGVCVQRLSELWLHCKCANALSVSLLIDRNTSLVAEESKSKDGETRLLLASRVWILVNGGWSSTSSWWDFHKNPDRKERQQQPKAIDALTIISDVVIKSQRHSSPISNKDEAKSADVPKHLLHSMVWRLGICLLLGKSFSKFYLAAFL